jgi:energy-coupling factor transport system ATP-binding protein
MTSSVALSAENVWFSYPGRDPVLSDVSLQVRTGEFVALVGQNGSGKTTLAKHFNALLRPDRGRIEVQGTDIAGRATAQLAPVVGYCYQNPDHQIFAATVAAEIEFGPRNLGLRESEVIARTRQLLDLVGLRAEANEYPFSLGRGQRQKLAVASVLAMEPTILIVDEPTTGLDWRGGRAMMQVMRRLHESGHTLVIITHDMNVVAEYASRVVCMTAGRVIADGSPRDVFDRVDALAAAGLRPPQALRIARALPHLFPVEVVTVDEAARALVEQAMTFNRNSQMQAGDEPAGRSIGEFRFKAGPGR